MVLGLCLAGCSAPTDSVEDHVGERAALFGSTAPVKLTLSGPLEQHFRLATVTVTTASAKGPVRIDGLDHERAEELVRKLTAVTQATDGDAT